VDVKPVLCGCCLNFKEKEKVSSYLGVPFFSYCNGFSQLPRNMHQWIKSIP
jgi:hypothetical protein